MGPLVVRQGAGFGEWAGSRVTVREAPGRARLAFDETDTPAALVERHRRAVAPRNVGRRSIAVQREGYHALSFGALPPEGGEKRPAPGSDSICEEDGAPAAPGASRRR